jgi:hypothetical protein
MAHREAQKTVREDDRCSENLSISLTRTQMLRFIAKNRASLVEFGCASPDDFAASGIVLHAGVAYCQNVGFDCLFAAANPNVYRHVLDRCGVCVIEAGVDEEAVRRAVAVSLPTGFFLRNPASAAAGRRGCVPEARRRRPRRQVAALHGPSTPPSARSRPERSTTPRRPPTQPVMTSKRGRSRAVAPVLARRAHDVSPHPRTMTTHTGAPAHDASPHPRTMTTHPDVREAGPSAEVAKHA